MKTNWIPGWDNWFRLRSWQQIGKTLQFGNRFRLLNKLDLLQDNLYMLWGKEPVTELFLSLTAQIWPATLRFYIKGSIGEGMLGWNGPTVHTGKKQTISPNSTHWVVWKIWGPILGFQPSPCKNICYTNCLWSLCAEINNNIAKIQWGCTFPSPILPRLSAKLEQSSWNNGVIPIPCALWALHSWDQNIPWC